MQQQQQPGGPPQYSYPAQQPAGAYPPQQVAVTQPQPVQTNYVVQGNQQDGCCSGVSETFNHNGGLGTGIVQLIIAILSIILGGASIAFSIFYSGYGIWSGLLFYLPSGILGIVSKNKSTCVITAYLVMSILCALESFGMIIYEGAWAGVSSCNYICYYGGCSCDSINVGSVAIHSVLAILAFVEFIVSIVASAICCGGLACCCAKASTSTTTTYYNNPGAQTHVVVAGQPQQGQQQQAHPQKY